LLPVTADLSPLAVQTHDPVATLGVILAAGVVARPLGNLLRLPPMLLLLIAGIVIGPSTLGLVDVSLRSDAEQLLLTLGVSFVLFHGGLHLSVRILSKTYVGLLLLVVPGVFLTAAVTGGAAALAFGLPFLSALLIGAALAPTDPAILIPLFDRLGVRPRVAQTIVAESALNDPTGAVLALAVAAAVLGGHGSIGDTLTEFVTDIAVSTALGVGFGVVLALVVSTRRFGVSRESASLAVAAIIAGSFFVIDFAGGSGYLGAFLAGLILGNMDELGLAMDPEGKRQLDVATTIATEVVIILVFVTLGANLPLSEIADDFLPALVVVATLVLIARPLAVAVCLVLDRRARWTRQELLFMAWTRETGVVPAALAGVIVGMGVPDADLVVVCVGLALVTTVLVQTTTKPWLARRLGLIA
jgi:cell volume regulation protein A